MFKMSIRVFAIFCLPLLAITVVLGRSGPPEAKTLDGGYTGEIKPLLYVSDVEKSAPFYRDVLGFSFEGYARSNDEPYYAEMTAAGRKFGLHEPTVEGQESKIGQGRLYFRVRDVEAQRRRVLARGSKANEIKRTDWMDFFIVHDPDGNEIAFALTDPERHSTNPWTTRNAESETKGKH